nr:hypothetical protein Iba_chr04aCG20420 [Ipomoea batatas]
MIFVFRNDIVIQEAYAILISTLIDPKSQPKPDPKAQHINTKRSISACRLHPIASSSSSRFCPKPYFIAQKWKSSHIHIPKSTNPHP